MKIELRRVTITKAQIEVLGEPETHFFFLITQFSNELAMLRKLVIFSGGIFETIENQLEEEARAFQTLFLTKVLAGKLYEGWLLLQKRYSASKVSLEYSRVQEMVDSVRAINRYFNNKDNLIQLIRHKYAFHNQDEHNVLPGMFASLPADYKFENYIAGTLVNTLYYGSEDFILRSLLTEVRPDLENTANVKIPIVHESLIQVSGFFDTFIRRYILEFINRYNAQTASKALGPIKMETIELRVPDISKITLPYFSHGDPTATPH